MTELYVVAGLLLAPVIICGLYARSRVNQLFDEYSRKPIKKGVTGGRLARTMLDSAGLSGVIIEEGGAALSDHYDPRRKVIRLSPSVSRSASIAGIGIAAHEAAHAIQDGTGYPPVKLRDRIAPLVERSGHLVLPLLLVGMLFSAIALSSLLVGLALLLFLVIVLFYLVTLPVELEASSRALGYIRDHAIADEKELEGVRKVLRAAAFTYVTAMALVLIQFFSLLGTYRRK